MTSIVKGSATGKSFRMFDYAPHGLAMMLAGSFLWLVFGRVETGAKEIEGPALPGDQDDRTPFIPGPLATVERRKTLLVFVGVIVFGQRGMGAAIGRCAHGPNSSAECHVWCLMLCEAGRSDGPAR
ncbi:MAG: hypothetical protein Q8P50_18315 [Bacillota bacterium]|nr:hypothetical protein [Bacillota bacterium]